MQQIQFLRRLLDAEQLHSLSARPRTSRLFVLSLEGSCTFCTAVATRSQAMIHSRSYNARTQYCGKLNGMYLEKLVIMSRLSLVCTSIVSTDPRTVSTNGMASYEQGFEFFEAQN